MRPRGIPLVPVLPVAALPAVAAVLLLAAGPSRAGTVLAGPAGLRARVHDAVEVSASLVERGGRLYLLAPVAGEVELLTGPDDPRSRRATTAFCPHRLHDVREALAGVHGIAPEVEVEVFLLPAPPVDVQGSFCRGRVIFLSPGYLPVDPATTAYALTHELGHALGAVYLDGRPERWRRYEALRGLDPERNGPGAAHAWREREILAEDIRHLFGGPAATASGTIENPDLPLPELVPGLRELLAADLTGAPAAPAAACGAYPNPCNPTATIRLRLPAGAAGGPGELTVWDPRGRLVTRLEGGESRPDELLFVWDGRDAGGRACPSGRYLCRVRCGALEGRTGVVLLR